MKIGIYQGPGVPGDVAHNLAVLAAQVRLAAEQGCRLLLFPECWLTGYNIGEAAWRLAEPADGPSAEFAARVAREHGVALLYGYCERGADPAGQDAVYNAARLIGADGAPLANFRKLHLYGPDEQHLFRPGDAFTVVQVGDLRVGVLICYDVEFPEAVRAAALAGADLVAVPTALMQPHGFIADELIRVRAWESQVFVAYANRCGTEHGMPYVGGSGIAAPDGSFMARAGSDEALIWVDVRPQDYAATREINPYLTERRPDLYAAAPQRAGMRAPPLGPPPAPQPASQPSRRSKTP